jgi:hypothetical protein
MNTSGTRLPVSGNPLRLAVSGSPWRGAWYLAAYVFGVGWLLFSAAFLAVTSAAVFAVTLAGIPLLAAAAVALHGCADVERFRLRQVLTEPVHGYYQPVTEKGLIAQATTRWRDRATWRDVAYLIGLWAPLFILDTVVLTVWLILLAGIALPAWYWAPESTYGHGVTVHGVQLGYFPNGPHGAGGHGIYVQSLPSALAAAAVCLILFLIFNYVLVATARAHASVARSVLRAPGDPLAAARQVLTTPGPLGTLETTRRNGALGVGPPY